MLTKSTNLDGSTLNLKSHELVDSKRRKMKQSLNMNSLMLISDTQKKWYEIPLEVPRTEIARETSNELLQSLRQEAEQLLLKDVTLYNAKRSKERRSDQQWMQTVMSRGTTSDKIAAHIVQVQDSPVHSLSMLRNLVGMVKIGKKNECMQAMETLRELWLSALLIPGEQLRPFENRPVSLLPNLSPAVRNTCLLLWWFESCLKEIYLSYVLALDSLAREGVDSAKEKVINVICILLGENPEQEELLLRQAVNKLGDPQQKVASKAMYCLNKVLEKHPNMQDVVLSEVEKMLFRSNIGHKAQYYAICFLTQFQLDQDSGELATNLIRVYFCFFKSCIKKGDLDSRMLRVLLMGVNRAFPYAKDTIGDDLSQHIDTLHRLVHLSPFNVALHTLCLLFQISTASSAIGDRFYSALYKKIIDPELLSSSQHAAFLNLVYKAVNDDSQAVRVRAFIKRLLQVANYCPPPLVCGILYLVSQVLARKRDVRAVLLEPVLVSDVKLEYEDNDDEEEKFTDVKLENETDTKEFVDSPSKNSDNKSNVLSSWVHRSAVNTEFTNKMQKRNISLVYDPLHRNPLFSKADTTVYLELTLLARHFHPTVTLFANNILEAKTIEYSGDPLQDFTTARFLERFVFKNPKKMEVGTRANKFSRSKNYRPSGMKNLAVTSNSYLNEEEKRIPCEEVYLYRYLQKKRQPWLKSEEDESKEDSDTDSVGSDEFEQLLHGGKLGGVAAVDEDEQPDFAEDINGEFSSEEDEDEEKLLTSTKRKLKTTKKTSKRFKNSEEIDYDDLPDVFASAEEFADMLEDTGASTLDVQGSSGLENRDNAAVKQLHWEVARDQWIHSNDKSRHKNKRNNFNSDKGRGKKKKKKY